VLAQEEHVEDDREPDGDGEELPAAQQAHELEADEGEQRAHASTSGGSLRPQAVSATKASSRHAR